MKPIIYLGAVLTLLSLSGCYYDSQERTNPDLSNNCDATHVTYATCVKTIIDTNCKGCHSSSNSSGGVNLDNAASLQSNFVAVLSDVKSARMPISTKLSAADITTLDLWQSQGFVQ